MGSAATSITKLWSRKKIASASTGPSGVFAMTFDAAGNCLAKRMLALSEEHGGTLTPMMNDNLPDHPDLLASSP